MSTDHSIAPYLRNFRRQLRIRDGWLFAQRTLWIAFAGTMMIFIIGRIVPIRGLMFLALTPMIGWLCVIIGFIVWRTPTLLHIAQRVDLELALKERLSTALELEIETDRQFPTLSLYQRKDALDSAKALEHRKAFPFYWLPRPLLVAAGFLVAALLLAYLPNPMDTVLAERREVEQAAQDQANKIDDLKEEISQSNEISPEKQAELIRQLDELAEQLRHNPGDREKALADLSKLEEHLRRQFDPNANLKQASLDTIAAQLEALAKLDDADLLTTTEALEQIADELAKMSQTEQQELADALAQMAAQAAQTGDQTLAQALASMSQAALSGNSAAASQAASEISSAMAQSQQELNDQQILQQALGQLQSSSQAMAQAGQASQPVAGQGPGQGNQGNNSGQGQSGQGMSGGGTKADTLPPGTGSGQVRRPNENDTGAATSELGEQVFVPWDRRSSEGEGLSLPGQDTGQGETIIRENPNPSGGLPGNALIPYQQVYTQYVEAAQQAISSSDIPSDYRDLVREYFTKLEP